VARALLDAYVAGDVTVVNSFRAKLLHKKMSLALLSDDRYGALYTPAQRRAIRTHVPWTRKMREGHTTYGGRNVDLVDFVMRAKDRLVLKPNDEYGGKGVLLGWELDGSAWAAALQSALRDGPGTWILQERVPVRRETFPMFDADGEVTMRDMLVDLAPYLWRGKMAGYLTRLSVTGLANVTSGGGQVPAFVVD